MHDQYTHRIRDFEQRMLSRRSSGNGSGVFAPVNEQTTTTSSIQKLESLHGRLRGHSAFNSSFPAATGNGGSPMSTGSLYSLVNTRFSPGAASSGERLARSFHNNSSNSLDASPSLQMLDSARQIDREYEDAREAVRALSRKLGHALPLNQGRK